MRNVLVFFVSLSIVLATANFFQYRIILSNTQTLKSLSKRYNKSVTKIENFYAIKSIKLKERIIFYKNNCNVFLDRTQVKDGPTMGEKSDADTYDLPAPSIYHGVYERKFPNRPVRKR